MNVSGSGGGEEKTPIGICASDEALMVRAQGDDGIAFAELYKRYAGLAMHIALAICGDSGYAEEIVQDGFFSIWRSRAGYRPEFGSFGKWSMRIVHNRAVDRLRSDRGRTRVPPANPRDEPVEESTDADSPFDSAVAGLGRARLLQALRHLPDRQTEVIALSYYGELSLSEVAARLGVPAGTVKGRMRLGLEKLRHEPFLLE
jgi:RNA polymerase sigma-70 factor (ECF subfamily)